MGSLIGVTHDLDDELEAVASENRLELDRRFESRKRFAGSGDE
jgi:hypothetical protein